MFQFAKLSRQYPGLATLTDPDRRLPLSLSCKLEVMARSPSVLATLTLVTGLRRDLGPDLGRGAGATSGDMLDPRPAGGRQCGLWCGYGNVLPAAMLVTGKWGSGLHFPPFAWIRTPHTVLSLRLTSTSVGVASRTGGQAKRPLLPHPTAQRVSGVHTPVDDMLDPRSAGGQRDVSLSAGQGPVSWSH